MTDLTEALATQSNLTHTDVLRAMARAPVRYKDFEIPKRGGGMRPVSQPAPEVKLLQRALMSTLLSGLPIHPAATAYREGASIRDNAGVHAGNGPILKMDFKEFFPSIMGKDWINYCKSTGCLVDPIDIELTTLLLFRRRPKARALRLAIGAPSSPMISNALMFEFDRNVAEAVAADHVKYTRYADDLTFSAPRTGHLTGVEAAVRRAVRAISFPRLRINEEKTVYATRKFRRTVTGLVLTNDGDVSIGRDKKRRTSAAMHYAIAGKLSFDELRSLCGVLAFINSVEPAFLDVLRQRYGADQVGQVQSSIAKGRMAYHHTLLERVPPTFKK